MNFQSSNLFEQMQHDDMDNTLTNPFDDMEGNYCWTRDSSDDFSPYTYSTESSYNSVATDMSAFDRVKRGEIGKRIRSIRETMKSSKSDSSKSLPGDSKTSGSKLKNNSTGLLKTDGRRSKVQIGSPIVNLGQIKDIWIETCDLHPGNLTNVNHSLPPPCNLCKASNGHGQKGRAFRVPKLYQVLGNDVQTSVSNTGVKSNVETSDIDVDIQMPGGVSRLTLVDKIKAVFHNL